MVEIAIRMGRIFFRNSMEGVGGIGFVISKMDELEDPR